MPPACLPACFACCSAPCRAEPYPSSSFFVCRIGKFEQCPSSGEAEMQFEPMGLRIPGTQAVDGSQRARAPKASAAPRRRWKQREAWECGDSDDEGYSGGGSSGDENQLPCSPKGPSLSQLSDGAVALHIDTQAASLGLECGHIAACVTNEDSHDSYYLLLVDEQVRVTTPFTHAEVEYDVGEQVVKGWWLHRCGEGPEPVEGGPYEYYVGERCVVHTHLIFQNPVMPIDERQTEAGARLFDFSPITDEVLEAGARQHAESTLMLAS